MRSLFLPDFTPPPPLPIPPTIVPQLSRPPRTSHSINPSILIVGMILLFVVLVSAFIHHLLRFLSRFRSPSPSPTAPNSPPLDRPLVDCRHPSNHRRLIDSLPIFSFDSVATAFQKSAPDCAVCLSRFEHHDQLRLLPACCHAFHCRCIDAWLTSNLTCPLCRSSVLVDESLLSLGGESFRVEIGSVSRRGTGSDSRRSYSMGSFDYVVDDDVEAQVAAAVATPSAGHQRGLSESTAGGNNKDKDEAPPSPPGGSVAEAVGGRGWLREYVDRLASSASSSFNSSRALSFRMTGRSSGRRSDTGTVASRMSLDMDRTGDEVSQFFRWLTGCEL